MTRAMLKENAKVQLGHGIFHNSWMIALLVCLIAGCIKTGLAFTGIGTIIVSGPLAYGASYCFLKQARDGETMSINDMFKGFTTDFGKTFLLGLMTSLFTILWSFLFVIPGIIAAYSYSMAFYISIDNPNLGWNDCIKASKKMMAGHKMELFILDLSFIGWYIVGGLCFGIGTLWVDPYLHATRAQFYKELSKEYIIRKKFEEPIFEETTFEESENVEA